NLERRANKIWQQKVIPPHFFPRLVAYHKIQEKRLRLQKATNQELGWKWGGMLIIVVKFSSLQDELENFNNYGRN
ncbi:MAG: hypothetical protein COS30_01370, partial [Candidatus Portnoybacteria bacterium CG02_land_8_20_14_3_00_45_8]